MIHSRQCTICPPRVINRCYNIRPYSIMKVIRECPVKWKDCCSGFLFAVFKLFSNWFSNCDLSFKPISSLTTSVYPFPNSCGPSHPVARASSASIFTLFYPYPYLCSPPSVSNLLYRNGSLGPWLPLLAKLSQPFERHTLYISSSCYFQDKKYRSQYKTVWIKNFDIVLIKLIEIWAFFYISIESILWQIN